jgi:hypothetical protein
VAAVLRKAGGEEPAPARILAERENRADLVVRRPERREERASVNWHGPILGDVELRDELERVAARVGERVGDGTAVSGILATERAPGRRVYLCSLDERDGLRSWLAVTEDATPVTDRAVVRAAASIAALCEIAADNAGGGDVDGLIASLADLREREAPEGIEEAEEAARSLREVLGEPPRLATPELLDEIGAATRRLERELDPGGPSPFAAALKSAQGAVEELEREIEAGYRLELT